MNINVEKFYLARSGKISGPYTEADIKALESRGELLTYTWIWVPGSQDWKPLDPKPTQIPGSIEAARVGEMATSSEAYALWGQNAIRGRIEGRTELGFELVYSEKRMLPPFATGMTLQIMDVMGSQESACLYSMKISEIERKGESWVLFLRHQRS